MALSDRTGPPTRFPSGVTNTTPQMGGASLPIPDKTLYCDIWDDFTEFTAAAAGAAGWVVTSVGALAAGQAVADAKNGILQVTTSAGTSGAAYFEWAPAETHTLESTKEFWFRTKFSLSAGLERQIFYAGLHVTDTSPLDATHRILVLKANASNSLYLAVDDNTTETSTAFGVVVAGTMTDVMVHYDGASTIEVIQDDAVKLTQTISNLPGAEPLAMGFGVLNTSSGESKTFSMDYMYVLEDR